MAPQASRSTSATCASPPAPASSWHSAAKSKPCPACRATLRRRTLFSMRLGRVGGFLNREKASASFLKKRNKKLLLLWPSGVARALPHATAQSKKFFCFFFVHKEKSFLTWPSFF